jgi:hypothetical protein
MPAGAKPGERRGGRTKGTPNHATKELKELARQHCPAALATIVQLMQSSENDQTKLAAAKELIDRGYGKAAQAVEIEGTLDVGVRVVSTPQDEAI